MQSWRPEETSFRNIKNIELLKTFGNVVYIKQWFEMCLYPLKYSNMLIINHWNKYSHICILAYIRSDRPERKHPTVTWSTTAAFCLFNKLFNKTLCACKWRCFCPF